MAEMSQNVRIVVVKGRKLASGVAEHHHDRLGLRQIIAFGALYRHRLDGLEENISISWARISV